MTEVSGPEVEIRRSCARADYQSAAATIMRAYGSEILRFLHARLHDDELASEAFSTFAEDLWRGIPEFEGRSTARVWSYAVARHAASRTIDTARHHRRLVPLAQAAEIAALEHQVRTATLPYLKTEVKDRLEKMREQLSPEDQLLLLLRVNRALSWKEVAHVVLYEGKEPTAVALAQEAARLRKRFQILKEKLRNLSENENPSKE